MVRHVSEATTTLKDTLGASPPSTTVTTTTTITADDSLAICRPEHGFHAFDALYCSLTNVQPVNPLFSDDK
jgi:AMME syndrome candidate gene 1 protein